MNNRCETCLSAESRPGYANLQCTDGRAYPFKNCILQRRDFKHLETCGQAGKWWEPRVFDFTGNRKPKTENRKPSL
jgi:hypothetical protein